MYYFPMKTEHHNKFREIIYKLKSSESIDKTSRHSLRYRFLGEEI